VAIGTHDPVTFAIAMDALNHVGPADPARIDRAVCAQAWGEIMTQIATYPHVKEEPPLKPYARS
jgi:hypothetical protein